MHKRYGDVKAVQGVSLAIKKGEMFGLVGPDGAGKTTTIRALCGLHSVDEGSVELFGMDIDKNKKEIQNRIGYLSQKFSLYGDLSVDENIEFFADIHGVKDYKERRDELLRFTRLIDFRKRQAERLSGGMKQKLALACSLIHRPQVLFLDEPTTGVDPVSRRDFWKILSGLQKDGITIFMSTPYLDEAERCNRVAMMHKGILISMDTPAAIKSSINREVLEIVTDDIRITHKLITGKFGYDAQLFGDRIHIVVKAANSELKKISLLLAENSINILDSRTIVPSLENVFIYLVKENESKKTE